MEKDEIILYNTEDGTATVRLRAEEGSPKS